MIYSRTIRILHALLALTIVFQLVVALVMAHPHSGRTMSPTGAFWFQWHEWVGLAAAAVLLASWLYRLKYFSREGQSRLFPWLNGAGRDELIADLRLFFLLKWKALPETGALAGAVHGLGLLIATAMAVSGTVLFFGLWPDNVVTPSVHSVMEVHSTLATLMWAYLYGHTIMAIWHQFLGHGSIARMFRWG